MLFRSPGPSFRMWPEVVSQSCVCSPTRTRSARIASEEMRDSASLALFDVAHHSTPKGSNSLAQGAALGVRDAPPRSEAPTGRDGFAVIAHSGAESQIGRPLMPCCWAARRCALSGLRVFRCSFSPGLRPGLSNHATSWLSQQSRSPQSGTSKLALRAWVFWPLAITCGRQPKLAFIVH